MDAGARRAITSREEAQLQTKGMIVAVVAALAFGGSAAPADTVCRPNTLGNQFCPVTLPPPRPIYRRPVQAIERVLRAPEPRNPAPVFVPSRETERLGNQTITDKNLRTGICRKDTLGNLLCR
jgi:hypothetical protein